ncbi:DUF3558 domain-containing protein [Nocardia vinacea]|uniref:DUF3558 domain-containing protein n=1 Tax=Nocardia vinacea TaxID=96468 RepID=A0ABZ1Z4A7_9NOCA|nr:DUF3558 domain-containing protein [Nocardia vinacea]
MPSFSCACSWWMVGVVTAAMVVAGCETGNHAQSAATLSSSIATSPVASVPPQPWTMADLTYHPCSVLDADDIARLLLQPTPTAEMPPRALPACTWFSVQTSVSGSFNIGFAPNTSDLTDLDQRKVRVPLEQQITIDGHRAVLAPSIRPDGRNGGCSAHVSVPSGGSFYLGVAVPGISTGVDWDVCAKTIGVAATILARLR